MWGGGEEASTHLLNGRHLRHVVHQHPLDSTLERHLAARAPPAAALEPNSNDTRVVVETFEFEVATVLHDRRSDPRRDELLDRCDDLRVVV